MAKAWITLLEHRGLLLGSGPDLRDFLQGIVSSDVTTVTASHSRWSAFLTPQGKFLHEFFIADAETAGAGDGLLLECEAARREDLMKRLSRYKLRAKASLTDVSDDFAIAAAFGPEALASLGLAATPGATKPLYLDEKRCGLAFVDPRLAELGARLVLNKADSEAFLAASGLETTDPEPYDQLRISLGVPDGSRDLQLEKSILLENGFEELKGVDFDKGCFMGQELTARTKYRALIKKRLMPVKINGSRPATGSPVTANSREVGTLFSTAGDWGLALLRLEAVENNQALQADQATVIPHKPDWANY